MKNVVLFLIMFVGMFRAFSQTATCPTAEPVCSSNGSNFPLTTGPPAIAPGSLISNPWNSPIPAINGITPSCFSSNGTNPNWFLIHIGTSGALQFTIGGAGGNGFYDWVLWPVNSQDPNSSCPGITTNNNTPPAACNWNSSSNGFTGMWNSTTPPPGGNASNFTQSIQVTAGQAYVLCFSNWSSLGGFSQLSFPTGPGIATVTCTPNTPDQTICLGNSAIVNISASGPPITSVQWLVTNGVSNVNGITNVTVTPTVTTDYIVQINQGANILMDTFRITVATPPAPNAGPDQTVCLGTPISLSGTLGSSTNTANWQAIVPTGLTPAATATFAPNFSSLTPTVTVNQPGVYRFVLRETSTVCGIIRDTVQVTVSQLQVTTAKTDPTCFGFADGSITINSVGASEYSFNNGTTWGPTNTLATFAAGTYTVCARNSLGCQRCTSVTLGNPPAVTLLVSNDTTVCQNGTASLSATASNGATFDYHWVHTPSLLPNVDISPLTTGYYSVYAENNLGCVSASDSIYVIVNPPIGGQMSPDVYTCPGYPDSLMVFATGGRGEPYTFTWTTGLVEHGESSKFVGSPAQTSTYSVTITDACESTPLQLSGMIHVFELPIPQIAVDQSPKCEPAVFELYNMTLPSMSASTVWKLSNGDVFTNLDTIQNSPMMNGAYDVQLIVTSPDGCIDSTTFPGFLLSNKKPHADFSWSPNPVTMFNTEVYFSEFTSNTDSYEWSFVGATPNNSSSGNQTVNYPDGQVGTYHVTLVAHSNLGCSDTITKEVKILPEVLIYAPNAFTPDGDEFNQTWRVYMEGIDVHGFQLHIFNRWGEVVWESHDPSASWDGTYNGKIVPYGTYTWVIETKEVISDKKYKWNGSISIFR